MALPIHTLIKGLLTRLMEPEHRRLNESLLKLSQDNKRLHDTPLDAFLLKGVKYCPKGITVTIPGPGESTKPLHHDLEPEGLRFLEDKAIIEQDTKLMQHVLFNLLSPCSNHQDLRDAIPEFLMTYLPGLRTLPRTRESAWTLAEGSRHHRQYLQILPKLEMYAASRLLY